MNCPKCHAPNFEGTKFCSHCGAPLDPNFISRKSRKTLFVAHVLNIIAMCVGGSIYLFMIISSIQGLLEEEEEEGFTIQVGESGICSDIAFIVMAVLGVVIFLIGLYIYRHKNDISMMERRKLSKIYLALSIANLMIFVIFAGGLTYLICVIGWFFIIPEVMRIVAGIQFLMTARDEE